MFYLLRSNVKIRLSICIKYYTHTVMNQKFYIFCKIIIYGCFLDTNAIKKKKIAKIRFYRWIYSYSLVVLVKDSTESLFIARLQNCIDSDVISQIQQREILVIKIKEFAVHTVLMHGGLETKIVNNYKM